MISLPRGNLLIQTPSELPALVNAKYLYMDFETTSFTDDRGGDSPYQGDRICGVAITVDDMDHAYYVPIRHTDGDWNLPTDQVRRWLREIVASCKSWVNHSVGRFDAHFLEQEGIEFECELVCTLALSKLYNSDRLSYGLKDLCREWLGMPMPEEIKVKTYLSGIKSKNYACVPADILGDYACQDVQGNRKLFKFLDDRCTARDVWNTEIKVTSALYDVEKFGMPIDVSECRLAKFTSHHTQLNQLTELSELLGFEMNPNSSPQMYDTLVNQFGLPVLGYNANDNPTFDKKILPLYMQHPGVISNPVISRVIELITSYRKESQFDSLFLETYINLNVEGILHPSYNQCVRTGRMSCSRPNAQQLSSRAKGLIHPRPGMAILSCDYSQIEFRLIVHYINDSDAIAAYAKDPLTDFHQWVADLCGTQRRPAKTINFMMAFGGGKAKTIYSLKSDPDIIADVSSHCNDIFDKGPESVRAEVGRLIQMDALEAEARSYENTGVTPIADKNTLFDALCEERGKEVYYNYHERLPGIKLKTYSAADLCRSRGYVFNHYGRRRYLPRKASFRAFNSVIQSCAADVMKDRFVALAPRFNKRIKDLGIHIFALVHDEIALMGPTDVLQDPAIRAEIRYILESTHKFRVPLIAKMAYSDTSWADVKDT